MTLLRNLLFLSLRYHFPPTFYTLIPIASFCESNGYFDSGRQCLFSQVRVIVFDFHRSKDAEICRLQYGVMCFGSIVETN
jgi:hypothetical protein